MATIHIRNIPDHTTKDDVESFLKQYFRNLDIHTFSCFKPQSKDYANVTVLRTEKAQLFVNYYGGIQQYRGRRTGSQPFHPSKTPIFWEGRILSINRGRDKPSEICLKALEKAEADRLRLIARQLNAPGQKPKSHQRSFHFTAVRCGTWENDRATPLFISQYEDVKPGLLVFGRSALAVLLGCHNPEQWQSRMDVPYLEVVNVTLGHCGPTSAVTITLMQGPKMSEPQEKSPDYDLVKSLDLLRLHSNKKKSDRKQRVRVPSIGPGHEMVGGSCFVYQFLFEHPSSTIKSMSSLLTRNPALPSPITLASRVKVKLNFTVALKALQDRLADVTDPSADLPFQVKFQVERCAVNGILPPQTMDLLLPTIMTLCKSHGTNPTSAAIRRLYRELPARIPSESPQQFDLHNLSSALSEFAQEFREQGTEYDIGRRHDHIALIHRVQIMPIGYYLSGPHPEVKNRVLRKYGSQTDMFLRVTFSDQDGEPLRFLGNISPIKIFTERFHQVIDGMIRIAGHGFTFLGFSHSSLRTQTCWFMAPFVENGSLFHAQEVIKQLGDFSTIRCPAKCAARIGQTFSDTTASVTIDSRALDIIKDIERNGRVFSDGCGTISIDLLRRVWDAATVRGMFPTSLQVRFAGAKGMLSLDNQLTGEWLRLRPSMIKFESAGSWEIEICGTNSRALPMYLNRQYIKVLEDLGVPGDHFIDLQSEEVDQLRLMTSHPVNAANWLEANRMGAGQRLPSLIKLLDDAGLSFMADDFLRDTVELVALVQLRDIKHRARIRVKKAVTLYGIVDETGILQENEVYCVTESVSGGRFVLQAGTVAVARSPAMHPGDIQVVKAVDVPDHSPLNALHNCIVFSQHGKRDLPSQLAGGDLDGDLYSVIYDPNLLPKHTYEAADYPRAEPVDIGRAVQKADMTKFFIQFMESDQLVNISAFPSYKDRSVRPDFMAPGPRVVMTSYGPNLEDEPIDPDEKDMVRDLDPIFQYRYYESQKVLGRLYRAIDEQKFFTDLHAQGQKASKALKLRTSLMSELWEYIKHEAAAFQYKGYIDEARDIRSAYDHNILETIEDFTTFPSHPLTELEVFSGTIIGKSAGGQSKQVRELARQMKTRYDRDAAYTREQILRGEDDDREEALPRAMACLEVAMEERPRESSSHRKNCQSFKYLAAEICLKELQSMNRGYLRKVQKTEGHELTSFNEDYEVE